MQTVSRIAKNTIVTMGAEIVNKILALILTIAIARYLGDIGFGQYSFVITMMMLFQVLADFGLDALTIREVAKNLDKTQAYLGNILALKFGLGLVSFILLSIVINLMNKPAAVVYGTYIAGLTVIFFSLANTFNSIFNAHERLDLKALLSILTRAVVFGLTLLAIAYKSSLIVIISVILISEILRTIISWLICGRKFVPIRFSIDFSLCKKFLITSIPFALISIIALIYFKIDIVMLSLMKDDQVVGWYSAAYALLSALLFITDAYNLAIFPALSRYATQAKELLAFSWERSVKYLLVISLPISVGTTILADRFISLFYSSGYAPATSALQILIWTLPWIFVNSINMRVLYATDKQKEATAVAIISMCLNILFNYILIPKYSYIGASLATILVEIINVSIFFWLVSKLLVLKADMGKILPRPLFAALVMGVVIYYLRFLNLAVLIATGAALYSTLLFVLGAFDEDDKRIIRKLVPVPIVKR